MLAHIELYTNARENSQALATCIDEARDVLSGRHRNLHPDNIHLVPRDFHSTYTEPQLRVRRDETNIPIVRKGVYKYFIPRIAAVARKDRRIEYKGWVAEVSVKV